jgi:hypothetical protein
MDKFLRLRPWILECVEGIQKWWKQRKRVNEVDKNAKAVDSGDDKRLADELRTIADKVEERNKTN